MLTRPLVLTSESARHTFRQSLPPHVLNGPVIVADRATPRADPPVRSPDDSDWKLFGLSFCAFFTAFYSFIA